MLLHQSTQNWSLHHSPVEFLAVLLLAHNAPTSLYHAGGELHQQRLHRVGAGPAAWRQQLHADGAALHHVALLDARLNDAHEWRRKRKVVGKRQPQLDVRYAELQHVAGERRFGVDGVQPGVPFVQIVVVQFDLEDVSQKRIMFAQRP